MNRIGRIERESAAAVAHTVLIERMAFERMAERGVELMADLPADLMEERMAAIGSKAELSKLQTAIW